MKDNHYNVQVINPKDSGMTYLEKKDVKAHSVKIEGECIVFQNNMGEIIEIFPARWTMVKRHL